MEVTILLDYAKRYIFTFIFFSVFYFLSQFDKFHPIIAYSKAPFAIVFIPPVLWSILIITKDENIITKIILILFYWIFMLVCAFLFKKLMKIVEERIKSIKNEFTNKYK